MAYKNLNYYLGLVTHQYQMSPNAIAWLTGVLQMLIDVDSLTENMYTYFDIDNAVGVQLDALGSALGQSRYLPFNPTDGSSPILTDELYRSILRFKIGVNSWNGQVDSIYALWAQLFPNVGMQLVDNQDMSCTITFTGSLPQIVMDMINQDMLLPRPEGVRYTSNIASIVTLPFFSYDINDTWFTGYDYGYWDVSSSGSFGANPIMDSAETDITGTIITMNFDEVMLDPTGKQSEFTVNVGTSPISYPTVGSIRLNPYDNTKIDLLLVTSPQPIVWRQNVTLSYIGDIQSADGRYLSAFSNQLVTNTMLQPAAPTLLSGSVDVTGYYLTLVFSKRMASPVGQQIYFDVEVNGVYYSVSSCALGPGSPVGQVVLTMSSPIYQNAVVTVTYNPGSITSADGGILAAFSAFSVTNNSTYGTTQFSANDASGLNDGQYNVSTGTYTYTGNTISPGNNFLLCHRFPNVTVPKGSTIVSVKMTFVASQNNTGTIQGPIYGNAADNAVAPVVGADFYALVNTVSQVHWTVPDPTSIGVAYDTADLTPIVQEIVNRSGWASGHAMQFMTEVVSANIRAYYAYDYGSPLGTSAPKLTINYLLSYPPTFQSAWTSLDGKKIFISFDKVMANPSGNQSYFVVKVNVGTDAVTACALDTTWLGSLKVISLTLTTAINYGDVITLSYSGGTVAAADGGILGTLSNKSVTNSIVSYSPAHGSGNGIFYPAANTDDGYQSNYGFPDYGTSDINHGTWNYLGGSPGTIYNYSCRFRNVTVPQGATITSAKISFYCDNSSGAADPVNVRFTAYAIDSGTAITDTYALFDNPKTSNYLDWTSIGHWSSFTWYDTPDISGIIQEIINRPGWVSGNNITIFALGMRTCNGTRPFHGYASGANYPKLTLTWTY